ncbi:MULTISPECIES: hypothetical protein [Micromonospora]|uniref:Uncharacterized protein n=1 Tax=Micromonospora sicca TaxID=2202420 RepID=A0A317DNY5_9ACTN|nr:MULTISPECIES: hypothetical protein [unclassified Micromonospora]MBM0227036.1 hypothetical protein [Micromonospora sp. ATA51]MDZ5447827.1 hypothetical protein [Micromonospora sp. 4G57]MDZ5494560.1 hypothetical protein [Micromonospora sp. 4G53]PWR16367.1 hypothetical protein DKT69_05975 [Micromonospora sp. 4G51]
MSAWNNWWGRLAAVLGAVVLSLFVPVAAWASTGTGERVVEAAGRRPRGGAGLLCCLVVIAVVVLLVLWLVRRRRGRPR